MGGRARRQSECGEVTQREAYDILDSRALHTAALVHRVQQNFRPLQRVRNASESHARRDTGLRCGRLVVAALDPGPVFISWLNIGQGFGGVKLMVLFEHPSNTVPRTRDSPRRARVDHNRDKLNRRGWVPKHTRNTRDKRDVKTTTDGGHQRARTRWAGEGPGRDAPASAPPRPVTVPPGSRQLASSFPSPPSTSRTPAPSLTAAPRLRPSRRAPSSLSPPSTSRAFPSVPAPVPPTASRATTSAPTGRRPPCGAYAVRAGLSSTSRPPPPPPSPSPR